MNTQKIKQYFFKIIGTYLVGTLVAGILMFIITYDLETIFAGFLVPIFLLPSVFLYLICEHINSQKYSKQVGFFVPLFLEIIFFLVWYLIGGVYYNGGEGTELNLFAAILIMAVGLIEYYFLSKYEKILN